MMKKNFENFFSVLGSPWGAGGARPFFSKKINFRIFSKFLRHFVAYDEKKWDFFSVLGSPWGRGATPIFFEKINFRIFSNFLRHFVAYDEKILGIFFSGLGSP